MVDGLSEEDVKSERLPHAAVTSKKEESDALVNSLASQRRSISPRMPRLDQGTAGPVGALGGGSVLAGTEYPCNKPPRVQRLGPVGVPEGGSLRHAV